MSLPMGTAEADVDRFLDVLPGVVAEVRERLGAPVSAPPSPRPPRPWWSTRWAGAARSR